MFARRREMQRCARASSHAAACGTREAANATFKRLSAQEPSGPSVFVLLAACAGDSPARAKVKKIFMAGRARATADQDIIAADLPASPALAAAAVAAAMAHEVLTSMVRAYGLRWLTLHNVSM